jgi:uncharacterized protein (DUF1015 family)
MAVLKPFAACRYRLDAPHEQGRFAAPPYDMIDEECADALYARDPHNAVRIIQNRARPGDEANRDRHRRAAALLNDWLARKVLLRDPSPSLYLYRQRFSIDIAGRTRRYVRTGLCARVQLAAFEEKVIYPHEYTLPKAKRDRYELLEATECNTGQIFGLIPDEGSLYDALQSAPTSDLLGAFCDENGVEHEAYRIDAPERIAALRELAAPRTILIADGHHRYETALELYRATGRPEHGCVMMTLVSMADPGLVIRPFHRLVKSAPSTAPLDETGAFERFFAVDDLGAASLETINEYLAGAGDYDMLYCDRGAARLRGLRCTDAGDAFLRERAEGMSDAWNALNVSKINRLCVQGIMGREADGAALHEMMDFVNDSARAFTRAHNASAYRGCFFIRPIPIDVVKDIVSRGERMPQKSTNFFPKLYSGLLFNPLDAS